MSKNSNDLTPLYGRLLIRLISPFPNFDFGFIKPIRKTAVDLLRLRSGDRVLDAGCGPGGSFPFLVNAVGASGHITGIELSPAHAEIARRRVDSNGWTNVDVIVASADEAELTGKFNGLLMFAAPDVYASEKCLNNLRLHLTEPARIVVFGGKLATRGFGRFLNVILKLLYKLSFSTTPPPEAEPWRILAPHVEDIVVREYFFGLMFLLSATAIPQTALADSETTTTH